MKVTLLTVGEYPTPNGLHMSQVLGFAAYLKKAGIDVSWIALVPVENRLVDLLHGKKKLEKVRQVAISQGVPLFVKTFPICITYLYTYIFRYFLIRRAGKWLASFLINNNFKIEDLHIIHCRSYFAAAIAIQASKTINIKISFDMRSLLPPEIPLYFPKIGKKLYGDLKQWECEILSAVNISFLQCNRGIELLRLEGITKLPLYQPIAGFDRKYTGSLLPLSERLDNPLFGYIGGFGPWHSRKILKKVFESLKTAFPRAKLEILTSKSIDLGPDTSARSVSNGDVPNCLSHYLALIVPGTQDSDEYFSRLKSSSNFFSTKVAEALSIGLPIIINELNTELAEYVRDRGCGLIFQVSDLEINYESINNWDLHDPVLWQKLNEAALKCAPSFQRETVFDGYINAWDRLY